MKSFISWISLYIVAPLLFVTVGIYALFSVINPNTIKNALKEENAYATVVPSVLQSTANTNVSTGNLNLKEPWVQNAAEKAFPASDLEQKATTVIDSTFEWLEGTTETPDFTIDVTANKTAFAQEVGDYAQNRYSGLPACSRSNLPNSIDPLTIDCKVPGISANQLSSTISQQILSDKNFIANPVFSANNTTLNPAAGASNGNPFEQLSGLRTIYQHKTALQWGLPIVLIFFIALGLLLAPNRIKGLNRLGRSLIVSAVGLLLIGLLVGVGLSRLIDVASFDAVTANVVGPIITNLGTHARNVYFVFTGITIVASISSFVAARYLKKRSDYGRQSNVV